jgi:hypothetical protein
MPHLSKRGAHRRQGAHAETTTVVDQNGKNATKAEAEVTMRDAALRWAARGIAVFPCKRATKQPLTKHGFNDATTDERKIQAWWTKWPKAMIGVPTGKASGIDVLDLDLKPDEGIDGRESVSAGLSPLTVRTPSGGAHQYFRSEGRVRCTTDVIAPGVDTRGDGGYAIVPPSRNAVGSYEFVTGNENDLADLTALPPLPGDLLDKLGARHTGWGGDTPHADPKRVAAAMAVIPNPDLGWEDWKKSGMAIWRATGGSAEGLAIFDEWSQKSQKYNADAARTAWNEITRSPPTRIWRDLPPR